MPPADSLAQALERSVTHHAERPALWTAGRSLSYAALDAAGQRLLAEALPERRGLVAVIAERQAPAYAAIFALLRAGVGYVPINPRWPSARIEAVLDAACPDLVVLDGPTAAGPVAAALGIRAREPVIGFSLAADGSSQAAWLFRPAAPPQRGFADGDIAYIMFTSGSTGTPKGVPISRANAAHYVAALREIAEFGAEDRFIQTVELTFDLSVHDMLLCWTAGAMLVVVPESSAPLGPRFVRQLGVTSWLSVPSVAAQSKGLRLLPPGAMPSLRTSFFCGEALPMSLVETWLAAAPATRLWNIYGPTEATIAFSSLELRRDAPLPDLPVAPLGWPIGGQAMRLAADGELLLSGPQLSAGYLNDPDRTAKAFIEADGGRWYRTGDKAEPHAEYGFLFKGRLDSQIKLRGYRVELGEVEAALRLATGSDLVAAVAHDPSGPDAWQALAAFICGAPVEEAELRRRLRERLPEYMLPGSFRWLDAMPKNSNDKVDYLALRRLASGHG